MGDDTHMGMQVGDGMQVDVNVAGIDPLGVCALEWTWDIPAWFEGLQVFGIPDEGDTSTLTLNVTVTPLDTSTPDAPPVVRPGDNVLMPAPDVATMTYDALTSKWRVGSGAWSWDEECARLLSPEDHAAPRTVQLAADIGRTGIREPVLLGTDGRVWDGHHRIVLARYLHLPIPYEIALDTSKGPV